MNDDIKDEKKRFSFNANIEFISLNEFVESVKFIKNDIYDEKNKFFFIANFEFMSSKTFIENVKLTNKNI